MPQSQPGLAGPAQRDVARQTNRSYCSTAPADWTPRGCAGAAADQLQPAGRGYPCGQDVRGRRAGRDPLAAGRARGGVAAGRASVWQGAGRSPAARGDRAAPDGAEGFPLKSRQSGRTAALRLPAEDRASRQRAGGATRLRFWRLGRFVHAGCRTGVRSTIGPARTQCHTSCGPWCIRSRNHRGAHPLEPK